MLTIKRFLSCLLWVCTISISAVAEIPGDGKISTDIEARLKIAGDNRAEIEQAYASVPADQRAGMEFLIANMPDSDLQSLSAKFLLENTALAYQSRTSDPWASDIPLEVFFNDVLPYASINERRDNWRADFRNRFLPLVSEAKTTSEVATILNQKIFGILGVRYSTKRAKADQSPYESIEGTTASCTGLSVLLIDACRAVGVPARFVGTPLWTDGSGNHSWVEIWDDGWHFTGAAEPTGVRLNDGWFLKRASAATDDPKHAIYATSFRKTSLSFPCVWNRTIKSIPAVNVTHRYSSLRRSQIDAGASAHAVSQMQAWLDDNDNLDALAAQDFAQVPLTKSDTEKARESLAAKHRSLLRAERKAELDARVIRHGELKMPFSYKTFGEKPPDGWSLYISLHGGGGAPAGINDRQWENQKNLYKLEQGIYLAPRAPTDTWNLWHQEHIDVMLKRLIQDMVAVEDVNWNRVYVMGYSAGGDGVYQLAPRMSDYWAASAMMAGHPNETSPRGLRNVPFALQVGGRDAAYKRNQIASEWKEKLAKLHADDDGGYKHFVKIYPDKGHWMDREDAVAIPWMAQHVRNPTPTRIVWVQDDVTHDEFYWLAVDEANRKPRSEITAEVKGQSITLTAEGVDRLNVRLDDRFIDLDRPVKIVCLGKTLFEGLAERTIGELVRTLTQRGDPNLAFPHSVSVDLPKPFPQALIGDKTIPRYQAVRAKQSITVDGKLDEPAWETSTKTQPFVDLISGESTKHDTRAALLWDDEYLYVGFWLAEPNVKAKYLDRDDPIYYDNDVEIFIAGEDAYYEFEINAFGTVYEAFFVWEDVLKGDTYAGDPQLRRDQLKVQEFNGVGFTEHPRGKRVAFLGYDFPEFQSAVDIQGTLNDDTDTDQGWTVELAFAWKGMTALAEGDKRSLPPTPGDQWRIDLFRFNSYKTDLPKFDSSGWAVGPHGVWDSHIPELFPIVTFAD
ncbi:transglutaminase domain-containing protein [Aporhodopirellula aestuarii]|uniref:Polyhydroxyalkanoate depolymerase n=1 Tax=Aporhodopirellula aestuarii TaxID=2950107 RepID=A0ABT0U2V5_9BACT|nr:transglutaminase domain-containing protein [Aporhodopirellula aestuarii]MCM2370989.1 polyhydroxyalkanoate depolymerase [Aporhodopirellula aestuarii]